VGQRSSKWNLPDAKWFLGRQTERLLQRVDRQVKNGRADKVAIIFEANRGMFAGSVPGSFKTKSARIANALKALGVRKGDRSAFTCQ